MSMKFLKRVYTRKDGKGRELNKIRYKGHRPFGTCPTPHVTFDEPNSRSFSLFINDFTARSSKYCYSNTRHHLCSHDERTIHSKAIISISKSCILSTCLAVYHYCYKSFFASLQLVLHFVCPCSIDVYEDRER